MEFFGRDWKLRKYDNYLREFWKEWYTNDGNSYWLKRMWW